MTKSIADDVLDFAIAREQEAHDFYVDLANRSKRPGMKELFDYFAREELGHKRKLEAIKEGQLATPSMQPVADLKIADYTVQVEVTEDLGYQDALILAMKREKAAFRLYTDLAKMMSEPTMSATFAALAQEEAKHKLRFEVEYDDVILTDN
jgi:rubrerythrin